jgi:ATP-dependent protease ClpP protease subunit
MGEYTGKSKELIHRDFDRNKWLFAEEAVEYGCADKVMERLPEGLPKAKTDDDEEKI